MENTLKNILRSAISFGLSLVFASCLVGVETSPFDPNNHQGLANILFSLISNPGNSSSLVSLSGTLTDLDGNALGDADVELYRDESVSLPGSDGFALTGFAGFSAHSSLYSRIKTNSTGYISTAVLPGLYHTRISVGNKPIYRLTIAASKDGCSGNSRDTDTRFQSDRPDRSAPVFLPKGYPAPGDRDVPTDTTITLEFSEPLLTVDSSAVQVSNGVTGSVSQSGRTVTFRPATPLQPSTTYTVSIGSNVYDLAGNSLANPHGYQFTTGSSVATPTAYSIGGRVIGLEGDGLILGLGPIGSLLGLSQNGGFRFSGEQANGSAYSVTVNTQPTEPKQTCTIQNGSGTISSAHVANISVICTTDGIATYTIGGTVSGLSGTGLVIQNNFGDDLSLSANGSFTFPTALSNREFYNVSVKTHPTGQNCTAVGSGQINGSDINSASVTCVAATFSVGGTVTGSVGAGITLQNNGGDNLSITAAGTFTFATAMGNGATYNISQLAQPTGITCTLTNTSGTINSAAIDNVLVSCVPNCSVGGPTVIDPPSATGNAEVSAIATASGKVIVARRAGSALRIFGTDCHRQGFVTPYEADSFGAMPSMARFGNGTNALAYSGNANCSILNVDDNGNILSGPVTLVSGPHTSVSVTKMSSGNVMVACADVSYIRTFVVNSSLGVVSGPNLIPGYTVTYGQALSQLSDGRTVLAYRDNSNSNRGTIRILNTSGASVAGPTVFTGGQPIAWFSVVGIGATAAVVYGESITSLKMVEIGTTGTVVGGPYTVDTAGGINFITADRASDGTIYAAYYPNGFSSMRYVHLATNGSILGGPYNFGSPNVWPHLNLRQDYIVITTGEGVYVFNQ